MKILVFCLLCLCILPLNLSYSEARSFTPAEKSMSILNQLMESKYANNNTSYNTLPVFVAYVKQNGVLFVGIDNTIANQTIDVYKQRLVALIGNVPMEVHFGYFSPDFIPAPKIPKDLSLNFSIQSRSSLENSTVKDIHFRFFSAKTPNMINNVSFYLNVTKENRILEHDLWHTHSGFLTIHMQPKDSKGNWTVFGDHDIVLGGWQSASDNMSMVAPIFTEEGLYHFNLSVLDLGPANSFADSKNSPKFDSWWFEDEHGNVTKFDFKSTWMKKNYKWLQDGSISEQEFNNSIEYVMNNKILK